MPRDIKPAITLDALFPSLKGVKTHQVPLVADPALLGGPLFRPESRLRAGGTTETGGCHVEMGNVAQFYVTEGREAGPCPSRPSIGPELPNPGKPRFAKQNVTSRPAVRSQQPDPPGRTTFEPPPDGLLAPHARLGPAVDASKRTPEDGVDGHPEDISED